MFSDMLPLPSTNFFDTSGNINFHVSMQFLKVKKKRFAEDFYTLTFPFIRSLNTCVKIVFIFLITQTPFLFRKTTEWYVKF